MFKFVELQEKVGFTDAVRMLAQRFGIPRAGAGAPTAASAATRREREALLKVHEVAAAWFASQLAGPAGARARQQLADRGIAPATVERLGLGFAPPSRDGAEGAPAAAGVSARRCSCAAGSSCSARAARRSTGSGTG